MGSATITFKIHITGSTKKTVLLTPRVSKDKSELRALLIGCRKNYLLLPNSYKTGRARHKYQFSLKRVAGQPRVPTLLYIQQCVLMATLCTSLNHFFHLHPLIKQKCCLCSQWMMLFHPYLISLMPFLFFIKFFHVIRSSIIQ